MKLTTIKLKNFRGYRDETSIPFENLTAFIGKNDAGKSTILEALEIFFNSNIVACEREDLSINSAGNDIEITCTFDNFPVDIVIDAAANTSLNQEYLLNEQGKFEIKKVYTATTAKPKEKIYIVCSHPTCENGNDLLELKRADLKKRADDIGVMPATYNRTVNSSIRGAIWQHLGQLEIAPTQLLIDKEDTKKIYESIKTYLPLYALFQSDRQSNDDDKEVTDPMKIAVQQALQELADDIEHIKREVYNKTLETASRTLAKLKEMAPDLAQELIPEFKAEPKFDSQFKLTIKSENNIPINKRGSGVRRLILLNFFRAEAERRRASNVNSCVIYAFEEPETSQHPDHQEMLIRSFIDLANTANTQIILTTHTPALAGLLPLNSLRHIRVDGPSRIVEYGSEEVFERIVAALGLLPDPINRDIRALLLVEGKGDVVFIRHTSNSLAQAGHLTHSLDDKRFAIIPIGGCGNLKHWRTQRLAEQFNIPWCILLDSDKGTPEEVINTTAVRELKATGIKAYVTRRREPENYIHLSVLGLGAGHPLVYTDTCDAKQMISQAKSRRKEDVLETYWQLMTVDLIREVEQYQENGLDKFEFTDMIADFITLC